MFLICFAKKQPNKTFCTLFFVHKYVKCECSTQGIEAVKLLYLNNRNRESLCFQLFFKVESISFMRKFLYKIKSCVPSDPLGLFSNRYLKTGLPNLLASKNFSAFLLRKTPRTHPRSTDSKLPEEVPRNPYF